ncbi:MAG: class E sortase [Geodermatophilaceae bacterium]|nr:class E sortase [Geodermatophilaceae bacterium]
MRTDHRGGTGDGPQGFHRPLLAERDTSELSAVVDALRPVRGDAPTHSDEPVGSDDLLDAGQGQPIRTGRHQASHAARGRRDRSGGPVCGAAVSVNKVPRTRGDLVRTGIRGLGQTLITFGMIVLLFVVYELFITDLLNSQTQQDLTQELQQNWADDPTLGPDLPNGGLTEIPLGDGIAFIRIPRFGTDYVRVVVQGTDAEQLAEGPGHYVDSAMPGDLGNFALAGHRVSQGSPFLDLDQLNPGDAVVIETADTYFTYRVLGDPATGDFGADVSGVSGQEIVSPQEVSVVNPIPGVDDSSIEPTTAYLTLTTCTPKFSAAQRLIIHAALEGAGLPKADYPDGPPAMTGG